MLQHFPDPKRNAMSATDKEAKSSDWMRFGELE